MRKILALSVLLLISFVIVTRAQILGGGTTFSAAVTFNQSWLVNCPTAGTSLCNTVGCEPTTTMDACGANPSCATGTTGSDVWFKFFAQSPTANIIVNPTSAFDIAIQAFSGTSCVGLTEIGCVDATGNNQSETLSLSGLTAGTIYYFRIFGATSSVGARTGNYNFCGTTGLGSTPLPLTFISSKLEQGIQGSCIKWTVENEYDIDSYDIEFSLNGVQFVKAGNIPSLNQISLYEYLFCDVIRRNNGLYRIKIIEKNGKISYSPLLRNKSFANNTVTVFPNPAQHQLYLELPSNIPLTKQIMYKVRSVNGQVVQEGVLLAEHNINIKQLLPGNYVLQLMFDDKVENFRFKKN
ncbi:MAG: T9SS type A sorting domain-containing protein [Chitinophagaceae bacterium]|jgi:hypothetical protein